MDHKLWMNRRRIVACTDLLIAIEALGALNPSQDGAAVRSAATRVRFAVARVRILIPTKHCGNLARFEAWADECSRAAKSGRDEALPSHASIDDLVRDLQAALEIPEWKRSP